MLVAGITNIVVAFLAGIYSSLSLHPPLMLWPTFRWLPVAHFYVNASQALSKLRAVKPSGSRDYFNDAEGKPQIEVGSVGRNDRGFKELVSALKRAGIINENVDTITLEIETAPSYPLMKGIVNQYIRFAKGSKNVEALSPVSIVIIENAVKNSIDRKVALLTIGLVFVLFVVGMMLVLIDVRSKQ